MNLIDVSKPRKLSPHAQEQIGRKRDEQTRLKGKLKSLDCEINEIADNDAKKADEADDAMTRRLRKYRTRQGTRQLRFHLTGQREKGVKNTLVKAFDFIRERCKASGYHGMPIAVGDLAAHLRLSERQTYSIIDQLEKRTPHGAYAVYAKGSIDPKSFEVEKPPQRQPNPGVIVRLARPGKETWYAVTLPESREYHLELRDSLGRSIAAEKIRRDSVSELLAA